MVTNAKKVGNPNTIIIYFSEHLINSSQLG
jgi:hypothetical protein